MTAPPDRDASLKHFTGPYPWVRIANTLLDRIAAGRYTDRMPARPQIAGEFGISFRTATRILKELAGRGVIYRATRTGYYVTPPDGNPPERLHQARVRQTLLDRIASGELKPWETVPVIAVLCAEHHCGKRPVTTALTGLKSEGFLRYLHGVGYQVLPPGENGTSDAARRHDPRWCVQVERIMLDRINSGELRAGGPVPSRAVVAAELGVSVRTVSDAYTSLARQGVFWLDPQNHYHVSANFTVGTVRGGPPDTGQLTTDQLIEGLRWAWDSIYKIGASPDGRLEAWRTDGTGTVYADTPEALRAEIREDWPKYVAGVAL